MPEHLPVDTPVESAALNGQEFAKTPLTIEADAATFVLEDGLARVTCRVQAPRPIVFRLCRQCGFLRFAAVLYEGELRGFTPEELAEFRVGFEVVVEARSRNT